MKINKTNKTNKHSWSLLIVLMNSACSTHFMHSVECDNIF